MNAPGVSQGPAPVERLTRQSVGLLLALVVQAILGFGLSLYVSVPASISVTRVFVSIPLLTAHIVLGFLLLIGTAFLIWSCHRSGVPGLTVRAVLAFLAVLVAIQEGFAYTFTLNNDYSLGMLLAFLVALAFVALIVVRLRGSRAPAAVPAAPA